MPQRRSAARTQYRAYGEHPPHRAVASSIALSAGWIRFLDLERTRQKKNDFDISKPPGRRTDCPSKRRFARRRNAPLRRLITWPDIPGRVGRHFSWTAPLCRDRSLSAKQPRRSAARRFLGHELAVASEMTCRLSHRGEVLFALSTEEDKLSRVRPNSARHILHSGFCKYITCKINYCKGETHE